MKKNTVKAIMIQGTCSNAGKSIIAAGLCRIFFQDGYMVAPFKAQNMALNSYVTEDSLEMGRAQVTQAYACKIKPDVRMNPVLLKPASENKSQIIINGKPIGNMKFQKYISYIKRNKSIVEKAYNSLALEYDIIVIEGAGSPAEINLKKNDIVNMYTAKMTDAPVLIVGDIDRGGVFASFVGTLELLDRSERKITKGFIINKFRGNRDLLEPGIDFLERKTSKKVFGVVPMIDDLNLPDEDSVEFKKERGENKYDKNKDINIALIDLPYISNFTDFDAFETEEDVNLFVVNYPGELNNADMIIIPGSKNVIEDMKYLYKKEFFKKINNLSKKGKTIIGICGGYQMLGKEIMDPHSIESDNENIDGPCLLNITTILEKEKTLKQVTAQCIEGEKIQVKGYEIHHGRTETNEKPFLIGKNNKILGCINRSGNVWGTYIHGIFDNDYFRRYILNRIRKNKNLPLIKKISSYNIENEFTKLANVLRDNIDINGIYGLMNLKRRKDESARR